MKSIKLSTKKIAEAYQTIEGAKYQKMGDEDKIRLWKILRKLKPLATGFIEAVKDAQKMLLPTEDFQERLQQAIRHERALKGCGEAVMSDDEYLRVLEEYNGYRKLVEKAVRDLEDREEELELETISEEAFGKLMASNDWTFSQADGLDFIIG